MLLTQKPPRVRISMLPVAFFAPKFLLRSSKRGHNGTLEKYLNNKLPQHTHKQNNSTFYNNLAINEVIHSKRDVINSSPVTIVEQIPIDTMAPKHLGVKKDIEGYSTISPKNTTFGKSTKYQTIIQSQKSSI